MTYKEEILTMLPLARSLATLYNMAPGMYDRSSHGSDARSSKYTVDGLMHQDPVTGGPIMDGCLKTYYEIKLF